MAFTLSKKLKWVWLDSTESWEGAGNLGGSAKIRKVWEGSEGTEKAQKMKGQRFPSSMSTIRAIIAGQLWFQEHLSTLLTRGGRICSNSTSCVRHLPFTLLVLLFPFLCVPTCSCSRCGGKGGEGEQETALSSFRNGSFYLPPGLEQVLAVTSPQGTPSLAHFLKTSFSCLRITCQGT